MRERGGEAEGKELKKGRTLGGGIEYWYYRVPGFLRRRDESMASLVPSCNVQFGYQILVYSTIYYLIYDIESLRILIFYSLHLFSEHRMIDRTVSYSHSECAGRMPRNGGNGGRPGSRDRASIAIV